MTDMTREFLSKPEVYSKVTAQIPLKRLGVPEDVIGPFILLAAKESDFMTGPDHLRRRRAVRGLEPRAPRRRIRP